jgi:predicted dehydrogenase
VAEVYADFQAALADAAVDAVDIIVPPFLHHQMVRQVGL